MLETNILVKMTIMYSDDGGKTWFVCAKEDVPEWVQEPETIKELYEGMGAQAPGESRIWIGWRKKDEVASVYKEKPKIDQRIITRV